MLPHQERVIEEKKELEVKIEKLRLFLFGITFSSLERYEHVLLSMQYGAMEQYRDILDQRIATFGDELAR